MTTEKKRLSTLLTLAAFILLVPLIAMQFTEEVKWTLTDFIIAGGLLSELDLQSRLPYEN